MDEFEQYAVSPEQDEFAAYEVKAKPADEFEQYAAEPVSQADEFTQFASEPTTAEPESPTWISDPVKPEEIAAIAMKHGLTDVEDIKALSTQIYLKGGTVEGQTRPFAYAAGLASDVLLPGDIPAFIQKKMQDSDSLRAAMDDVASLSEAKQSTARTVGTLVGGLAVPGLGVSKALGAAERVAGKVAGGAAFGAAMGGVAGLAESKEGEELKSAGVGAALGGALGGGLGAVGGWVTKREAAKAEEIKDTILSGLPEQQTIMAKIDRAMEEQFIPGSQREFDTLADEVALAKRFTKGKKVKIPEAIENERRAFVQYVNGEESKRFGDTIGKDIVKIRHDLGEEATKAVYKEFRRAEIAKEFRDEALVQGLDKVPDTILKTLSKYIEPAMYMAERLDKKLGTNFNKYINEVSEASNRFKNKAYELSEKLHPLADAALKDAKASNMTSTQYLTELYHTLDGKPTSDLFANKKDVVQGWRNLFEDVRVAYNNAKGEEVIKKWVDDTGNAAFVPHRKMAAPEAIEIIQKKLYNLEDTLPQFKEAVDKASANQKVDLTDFIASLQEADANDVLSTVRAVASVSGRELTTVNELIRTVDDISRNPGKAMHIGEMSAKSAKSRTGSTPNLIRETNVIKLAEDLIMNSMKAAYVGAPASKMKADLVAAVNAGVDKKLLDSMGNLIQDIEIGSRAGTAAQTVRDSLLSVQIQARKDALLAERQGKPFKAFISKAISRAPATLSYLSDQIYPNTLGALTNPTSPLKNLMQPFMMTSPEVGYRYSIPTVIRGMAEALKNPNKAAATLKELGLHGEGWDKLMNSALTDPNTSKAFMAAKKVNAEAMELNMKIFSTSEIINRYTAYTLGKKTVGDMVSAVSNPGKLTFEQSTALNFINTMTDSTKRSVLKLMEELPNSDAPEAIIKQLEKEVAAHLIQKTIFDYNKANASIVARYMPAPMIVFTKFPTYLAGNILNQIEEKGVKGAAPMLIRNYLAPFALLGGIDTLSDEVLGDDNNIIKWVYGQQGLKGVSNLGGISGFRAFGNPTISAPFKVGGKIVEAGVDVLGGDIEAAGKALEGVPAEVGKTAALYGPTAIASPINAWVKWSKKLEE